MAVANVFGTPVLEGDRTERALTALNSPNEGGKRELALAYICQKTQTRLGTGVSTLCIFYNATGETLIYTQDHSSYGQIYDSYPIRVQNGQWAAFLHVKRNVVASGSVGFVVYRVRISDTDFCNMLLGWQTPWGQVRFDNIAYCDIFDDGKVDAPADVYKKMEAKTGNTRQHVVLKNGMYASAKIEEGTSPVYEAELTLEDVAARKKAAQDAEASLP